MRWSITVFRNIARIIGAGPLIVIETEVSGDISHGNGVRAVRLTRAAQLAVVGIDSNCGGKANEGLRAISMVRQVPRH